MLGVLSMLARWLCLVVAVSLLGMFGLFVVWFVLGVSCSSPCRRNLCHAYEVCVCACVLRVGPCFAVRVLSDPESMVFGLAVLGCAFWRSGRAI